MISGAVLATIQGAQNFPIEDPRAEQYPAFSQVDRWEVPAACFTAGPTVEKVIVGMLKPNLLEVSKGIEQYLRAKQRSAS